MLVVVETGCFCGIGHRGIWGRNIRIRGNKRGEAGAGVIVMLMRPLPGSADAEALPPPTGAACPSGAEDEAPVASAAAPPRAAAVALDM